MSISMEINSLRDRVREYKKSLENYQQRIEQLELLRYKVNLAMREVKLYQQSKTNDVRVALDMTYHLRGVFGYFQEQYYYLQGTRYCNCVTVSEELTQEINAKIRMHQDEICSIRESIDSLEKSIEDLNCCMG